MTQLVDPITHVVVLMLENRSFDQMLGAFKRVYPEMEGIDPDAPPRTNVDKDGGRYPQAVTRATVVKPDPKHELRNVLRQIEVAVPPEPERRCCAGAIRFLKSLARVVWEWIRRLLRRPLRRPYAAVPFEGRFVLDYSLEYGETTAEQRAQVMSYFPLDFLPALHTLGRHFTICDHWFASVPGPTWPNRFFAHSGTSQGLAHMPRGPGDIKYFINDQDTLFDRLNDRAIEWKIYAGDFPLSLLLEHQRFPHNARRYCRMSRFFDDARGPETDFPAYVLIEPTYFYPRPNDDHPPHDSMDAQALIAAVFNAIRENEALWNSTLLVVTYDEHGGFYDHVQPPSAVPPDECSEEYTFDRLGVRVPALLVSPWVEARVLSTVLDHTSVLKYLAEKWKLAPLGERVARANSIGEAIRLTGQPRNEPPQSIEVPVSAVQPQELSLNDHQRGLVAFSEYLEERIDDTPDRKAARRQAIVSGPQQQGEAATERAWTFIEQQKRRME